MHLRTAGLRFLVRIEKKQTSLSGIGASSNQNQKRRTKESNLIFAPQKKRFLLLLLTLMMRPLNSWFAVSRDKKKQQTSVKNEQTTGTTSKTEIKTKQTHKRNPTSHLKEAFCIQLTPFCFFCFCFLFFCFFFLSKKEENLHQTSDKKEAKTKKQKKDVKAPFIETMKKKKKKKKKRRFKNQQKSTFPKEAFQKAHQHKKKTPPFGKLNFFLCFSIISLLKVRASS